MELPDLESQLKRYFGYNSFREHQREAIDAILSGRDTVAILPTGAGKSLCYQLPALILSGTCIVISPLISLMQDQVVGLTKNGIQAAFLNSSAPSAEMREVIENLQSFKILYIAPERLSDAVFAEKLKTLQLSFFVVDEAHCISQWGHSFRSEYRQLAQLKKNFPKCPVMALTATATVDVQKDIIEQLTMHDPVIIKGSFDRPNLTLRINTKVDSFRQIKEYLDRHKEDVGIIYAGTRKGVDELHDKLVQHGYTAGKYHAGLSDGARSLAHHEFLHDKVQVMVATVAFGMGIHKPDIRYIIHQDTPQSIEQYYQEIGRAGRDGLPAECLLLNSSQDLVLIRNFLKSYEDHTVRKHMEQKMWTMYRFTTSIHCRRGELLGYFGEKYHSPKCQACDNCIDTFETVDGTQNAQKIVSCVFRLNQNFGVKHVIDVLRGSTAQGIISRKHDELSTYGLMKECSEQELRFYIDELLLQGILDKSDGEYPVLKWSDKARAVAKGEQTVSFRKRIFKKPKSASTEKIAPSQKKPPQEADTTLFTLLRQLRRKLADEEKVPAYIVFNDRSLMEMAAAKPQTREEFHRINGVGPLKAEKYAEVFLSEIETYCKISSQVTPES